MRFGKFSTRAKVLSAVGATIVLALPPIAHALNLDIFNVIDSTISEDIGGALSSLNSIKSTLQHDEQQVLFPLLLINQAHSYVNTVMTSYRSWMTNVFTVRINSAQLPGSQQLEQSFLSGSFSSVGNLGSFYNTAYGTLPNATAAPLAHRQMMDMDDALAKDALAQSVASDQVSRALIKIANQIETESASTAPGTADMLSASARAAELESLASQHKLLAAMLREEAGTLAHGNGLLKQQVANTQQLNSNLAGTGAP
jgi:replicative DNA helicase